MEQKFKDCCEEQEEGLQEQRSREDTLDAGEGEYLISGICLESDQQMEGSQHLAFKEKVNI